MGKISERKIAANRRNAKKSTGPKDTSLTRYNATKSGIFSQEVVITSGPAKEDPKLFEEFRIRMMEDLAPVGALEEDLADTVIVMKWRWLRAIRYETRSISTGPVEDEDTWKRREVEEGNYGRLLKNILQSSTSTLKSFRGLLSHDEELLMKDDPLQGQEIPWAGLGYLVHDTLKVDVSQVLGLERDWFRWHEPSRETVQRIITVVSDEKSITGEEVWARLRTEASRSLNKVNRELKRRAPLLKRMETLAFLPEPGVLQTGQRYETGLSNQYYKALHELERRQAARRGAALPAPASLEVDIALNG